MSMVRQLNPGGVYADENGYVTLSLDAWRYYSQLFATHGVDATEAMDNLDDFETALTQCKGARIYQLKHA